MTMQLALTFDAPLARNSDPSTTGRAEREWEAV